MRDNQENKRSAYMAVLIILNKPEYKALWQDWEFFAGLVNEFQELINAIEVAGAKQITKRTGTAKEKKQLREELIGATMKVVYGLVAYAVVTDDVELKSEIGYSKTKLVRSRDNVLVDRAQLVYEKAFPIRNELTRVRLKVEDIEKVISLKERYLSAIPEPRMEVIERKGATEDLIRLIKETDELLNEKLDLLMKVYADEAGSFVMEYFNAREIIDIGVRHMRVKPGVIEGVVVMEGTDIELEKVMVWVVGRKRVVKTKKDGRFRFWFKKEGMAQLSFELDGYEGQMGAETEIGPGKRVELRIGMRRVRN